MIEEEKAIQAAVFQSIELAEVKKQVENSINDKTKDLQPLLGLNTTTLRYAVTWEGMAEHEPLMAEIDKVLNANSELKNLTAQLQEKQNQLTGIREIQALKTEELNKQINIELDASQQYLSLYNFLFC